MAQLFATGIYTTLWTLPRRAENDSQTRDPHETKSHERTEFLVARNQSKHPDRGCAKASHDDRISGRGELDRASPKKMCEKFWTLSQREEPVSYDSTQGLIGLQGHDIGKTDLMVEERVPGKKDFLGREIITE